MAIKRAKVHEEGLNLVPIMNLVSILIPFLLMAAQFVTLAVIDSTLPAIGPPQEVETPPDKPPLMLSVAVTNEGFTVMGADAVLNPQGAPPSADAGPTVPCQERPCQTPQSYDYKALTDLLNQIKDEYPDDETVILVPESRIPYEGLVLVMGATREDGDKKDDKGKSRLLFPNVVIAGGAG